MDRTQNVVRFDDDDPVKLLAGTTFHHLDAGVHSLKFGWRGPLGKWSRGELSVVVSPDSWQSVFYRPPMWSQCKPTIDVRPCSRSGKIADL
jgi:hypothetical protein